MSTELVDAQSSVLDALVNGVSIVFILSLAVERVAAVFMKRDWQPLSFLRYRKEDSVRVDLSCGLAFRGRNPSPVTDIDPEELKGRLRTANAENTLLIGMGIALLCQANAFAQLPGFKVLAASGEAGSLWTSVALYAQICFTGAAAGVGSSFWYDLLGLLAEVRRTRASLTTQRQEGASGVDTLVQTMKEQVAQQAELTKALVASNTATGARLANLMKQTGEAGTGTQA